MFKSYFGRGFGAAACVASSVVLSACGGAAGGGDGPGAEVGRATEAVLTNYTPPPEPDFHQFLSAGVVDSHSSSGELVGTLNGTSAVTPDGAFAYTIPIRVPEGPNGMAPQLTLSYSSRGEDGVVGVGWQLTGLSRITRCRKTLAGDERVFGVQHTQADSFCLDGVKLMGVAGTYGTPNAEYRSERADYAKIVSYGSLHGGPEYFKVWGKDGRIREYRPQGNTFQQTQNFVTGQVETDTPVTHAFYLVSETDRAGNEITYKYADRPRGQADHRSEARITRIDYASGSRAVTFEYEVYAGHRISRFDDGVDVGTRDRLSTIRILAPYPTAAAIAWSYNLDYDESPSTFRPRLRSVEWCDVQGVCLPKTEFTWESLQEPDGTDVAASPSPKFRRVWRSEVVDIGAYQSLGWTRPLLADFNGDGRDDLIYHVRDPRDRNTSYGCGGNHVPHARAYLRLSNGIGGSGPVFGDPINISNVFQPDPPYRYDIFKSGPSDLNADGKAELLAMNTFSFDAHVQLFQWNATQNTLTSVTGTQPFFLSRNEYGIDLGDANGDGRSDVFAHRTFMSPPHQYRDYWALHLTTGAFQLGSEKQLGFVGCAGGDTILDVQSDGRAELAETCYLADVGEEREQPTFGIDAHGFNSIGALHLAHSSAYLFADINGDGLPDALTADLHWGSDADRMFVRLNTGRGFEPEYSPVDKTFDSSFNTGDDKRGRFRIADFNGDGRDDLLFLQPYLVDTGCGMKDAQPPELYLVSGAPAPFFPS